MGNMKVLFVCTGNSCRSPVAEALMKKIRPDVEVESAGTHVAIPISKEAKKYLAAEDAGKYLKRVPEDLSSKRLGEYDVIVTMKSEHRDAVLKICPECADRILVWDIDDPYFLSQSQAEQIFRQIKDRVREFADSL